MNPLQAWATYCGPGATPADLATRWNLDPVLLVALAASTLWAIWRGGPGRGALLAGLAILAIIFVSPLCALSAALFSARTAHHVLLTAVAAPLVAWGLPRAARASSLTLSTAVAAAIFWAWHAPGAYAWALSGDLAYWLMQASLGLSALWFWSGVRAARPLTAVAALLAGTIQMGLLGALLTFADRALYAPHFSTALTWGLTPLADQQAAGLIMWAPAAGLYLAAAVTILGRALAPREGAAQTA